MTLTAERCGILFDLDGVIVDTKEAHYASFAQLGKEEGYSISREQFKHVFGRRNQDIFPILYGHQLPPERVEWLSDRKEAIFRDMVRGRVKALPGVPELLPALRQAGFHTAIGTSTPRANVEQILAELGFTSFFQAIVAAEDVTCGKPDPQVFLRAAECVGIPPSQCVVIEDAVAGVKAAHNGGMKAVGVTTNHSRRELAEADRVVDSLAEIRPDDFLALLEGSRDK